MSSIIANLVTAVALQPGASTTPGGIPLLAAAVGLVGAIVGALVTGLISHRNLKAADLRRWSNEERVRKQHWERETNLRYHEDRLAAYKGLLEKTDPTHYRRTFILLNFVKKRHEGESDAANNEGEPGAEGTTELLEEVLKNEPASEVLAYQAQIELLATTREVQNTAKRLAEEAVRYGTVTLTSAIDPTIREEPSVAELEAELNERRREFREAARRELHVPLLEE